MSRVRMWDVSARNKRNLNLSRVMPRNSNEVLGVYVIQTSDSTYRCNRAAGSSAVGGACLALPLTSIGRSVETFLPITFYSTQKPHNGYSDGGKGIGKSALAKNLANLLDESLSYSCEKAVGDGCDDIEEGGKMSLAKNLASLVQESYDIHERKPKPKTRVEVKRFLEMRIKKKVKEQCANGKFKDLMMKVIADLDTLKDAYDCIRATSNVDLASDGDNLPFESIAEELANGNFDVGANTYSISTKGAKVKKEELVFPKLKLRVVQEAIRVALEVVYRPTSRKYLMVCEVVEVTGHGLPQEGVLSPVLMNIYLDLFDREIYRMSMQYETSSTCNAEENKSHSKLRGWFRRQINGSKRVQVENNSGSEIEKYLKNDLYLEVDNRDDISACSGPHGVKFLGTLIKRRVKESPAVQAVHKLKDKIKIFAEQKQEAWDEGAIRIGKKWLAHGLKKVKEFLLRISETGERVRIFRDSFDVCSFTGATSPLMTFPLRKLLHRKRIMKRLHRYGLTNREGYPRDVLCSNLTGRQSNNRLVCRDSSPWLRWYNECDNFIEVKDIISNQLRMSCVRTLAAKYRIHEAEIEKKFDLELSRIPSTQEIELEEANAELNSQEYKFDGDLTYGINYSGLCLVSLARKVSQSRPCNCFVMGCSVSASCVYTLHVMERQKFPAWKTGFSRSIHPSLHRRRIGLCKQHLGDLFLGKISLQSIDFGAWR
ncbi:hypothetical protein DH2020_039818 [Rehmannia glutinosa]|uniref:Uncharacterized protein n=1 Tax=Rehmannia glutinosa TaxID=99300 RepID=A0ABR0UWF3_REHGL